MLGLLVLVHELGHFLTAVWLGIKVDEFGIGYPPRAVTLFERNGVKYTLNWLPIGGFVRFGGEGETLYGVGSLSAASPWKKILVLVAGPLMNLFLAFVIFGSLFAINGVPTTVDGAEVGKVYEGTPAAVAGFQTGDIMLSVAGQPIGQNLDLIRNAAQHSGGAPITFVVQRGQQQIDLQVTPGPWTAPDGKQNPLGFGFQYGSNIQRVPASLPTALVTGFGYTWD